MGRHPALTHPEGSRGLTHPKGPRGLTHPKGFRGLTPPQGVQEEEEEGFYILASQQGCVDVLGKVFPSQKHWTISLPCLNRQNEPEDIQGLVLLPLGIV